MRARVYSNGGNSTGGFTFIGGQLTGALILAGNPSELLEAASKQYVDSSLVNLSASHLTTGTLPSARLPSFAGDIVKPAGSSTINLAPNGIVAGDYVKPTVDSKGRVTAGGTLVSDDITNLSWDKITTGKPTTLAGYGITDGISLSGGTLTGFLTFNGSVTGNMQAATKQYIDFTLSSSSGIAIGDIIRKPYSTTPAGFLKCNGGEVSKTTYSSLYATIGDRFSKKQLFTSGKPWEQQYQINDTQSTDITGWLTGTALPSVLRYSQAIVTKNRVYLLGGSNSTTVISTVYTAPINADGTLGAWSTGTSLPGATHAAQAIVIKNRVYVIGGYNGTASVGVVYSAPVNSDGTLGTWTTGTALPAAADSSQIIITNTRIYILGGYNGTSYTSVVYTAVINSDGTLGTWTTGTALPVALAGAQPVITKNRVYLCGGSNGNSVATVYTALINSDGTLGAWTTSTSLPGILYRTQAIVTKNRVYLLGGHDGTSNISTVYTAPINSDGTLGAWSTGTALPSVLSGSRPIITRNRIYLLGGQNDSGVISTVYTAVINGGLNDYSAYYFEDTSNYLEIGGGKPWTQQYQINMTQSTDITGWTATTSLPAALYASSVVVTKNRVYLLGGKNSSNVDVSTVYTAAINADGTLGTWSTDTSLLATGSFSQVVVSKNTVYLFKGGDNNSDFIYKAPINSDGTLGTWVKIGNLFNIRTKGQVLIIKNKMYYFGGENTNTNAAQDSVFVATINSDGTLGAWTNPASPQLPVVARGHQIVATKNRLYLIGGQSSNTIYSATITSDGIISATWTLVGTLPSNVGYSQAFITKNTIYLISGTNGSSNVTTTYFANIDSNGIIGPWTTGGTLPFSGYYHTVFATKDRIYSAGGVLQPGSPSAAVYMASILGGLNDYSPYYDGTIVPVTAVDSSTTFALPDLTQSEKFDTVSYIKY